jgi:hypothetical protein
LINFILLYADKLLHFFSCDAVLYWGSRGVDASQCHHHFHVRGVDAECGEPVAGGVFEDAVSHAQIFVFFIMVVAAAEVSIG